MIKKPMTEDEYYDMLAEQESMKEMFETEEEIECFY